MRIARTLLSLALVLVVGALPAGAQTRSTEPEPVSSTSTVLKIAAKKPKKMPQVGRDKIKNAKVKSASEVEVAEDGTETVVAVTEFDPQGNARAKRSLGKGGLLEEEQVDVDLTRDVITKVRNLRKDAESETDYDYQETEFEDGKDHLLKKIRMKKGEFELAVVEHEYDDKGRLRKILHGQSDTLRGNANRRAETDVRFDDNDHLTEAVTYDLRPGELNPAGKRPISRLKHTYGANGLVARTEQWMPDFRSAPPGPDTLIMFSTYTYDAQDRLTSVKMYRRFISEDVLVSEESHVYDSAGNEIETTHAIPAARDTSDKSPVTPASLAASRSRKTTRTFDNFGNVSSEEMVETVQGTVTSRKKKQVRYARFD